MFYDIESHEIVSIEQLEKEFEELKKLDPATYDYDFNSYIVNCMTYNNGTLERIK